MSQILLTSADSWRRIVYVIPEVCESMPICNFGLKRVIGARIEEVFLPLSKVAGNRRRNVRK